MKMYPFRTNCGNILPYKAVYISILNNFFSEKWFVYIDTYTSIVVYASNKKNYVKKKLM